MSVLFRMVSILGERAFVRRGLVGLYTILGTLSSKLHIDPVVLVPFETLGIDVRFRFHILNRDLLFLAEIFVNHVYDKYCILKKGDVVIDCGAYIGEFSVYAAKVVGEQGLVLAFEPNRRVYPLCRANIFENRVRNVKLFDVALGGKEGTAVVRIDRANLGATEVIYDPEGRVNVVTLSQFRDLFDSKRVKLLKVDVEGFGLGVLLGAADLLQEGVVENVAMEVHEGERGAKGFLEAFGYSCKLEGSYLYGSLRNSTKSALPFAALQ